MRKDKNLPKWGEVIKLSNRALLIFYKRYPQMVVSRFLNVIWSALTPYVGIYLSALVIDELAGNRDPGRLKSLVLLTLIAATVIALVSAFLNKWKETQNAGLWLKSFHIYSEKLLTLDYIDMDDTKTTELLAAIRRDQSYGGWGLYRVIGEYENLCSGVLTLLGGIFLTVSLFTSPVPESAGAYVVLNHPMFLVPVVAVMLLITYISPALSNKAGSYFAINSDLHVLTNRLWNFFVLLGLNRENADDVRIYRQDKMLEMGGSKKDNPYSSQGIFAKYSLGPAGFYRAASAAVSVSFTGVVYAFVCLKAWAGAFGLGAVTQYVASITRVSGSLSWLIGIFGSLRVNASYLTQVFEFLDIPNNMYQGSLTVEKRRDRKYEVEFRDVSFQYPGSKTYALHHMNMKFEIGKRLAVVGMNGSGKTTFIKLLCRLYDPTEGEILLNGIDIRKYNYMEYMMLFSVVFQDFKLFALPLGENVAGAAKYDGERVMDCLEKSGFTEKLKEMPKGLETYLYKDYDNDGVNISGGEGQKIAIARALYKDAPFIILDEPTAALDPIAEAEIYSKFDEIAGDKTAIYISHRLSSCKFCDEIVVFHEGSVIQQGTHASLVADNGGKYHELWHAQAQYYTEA